MSNRNMKSTYCNEKCTNANAYYKYCIVSVCENNIKTALDKMYFHMPKDARIRIKCGVRR